jgi:hypothetical protein
MTADEALAISERNGWRERQKATAAAMPPFTPAQRDLLASMLDSVDRAVPHAPAA